MVSFFYRNFQKRALTAAPGAETSIGLKMPKHYIWCTAAAQATTGSVASLNFMTWQQKRVKSQKRGNFGPFPGNGEAHASRTNAIGPRKNAAFAGFWPTLAL
jgi:hypothetical protein